MQEVFTISGAPDFDLGAAAKKDPAVAKLQNALRALGQVVRDSALTKIAADGAMGPLTVAATNRALTTHIGSGQATASVRTGKLSAAGIAYKIAYITSVIAAETVRRGGKAAAPPPKPKPKTAARPSVATMPAEMLPEPGAGGGFRAFLAKPAVVGGVGIALGLIAAGLGVSMMLDARGGGGAAPAPAPAAGFGAALTKQHFIAIADVLCTHSAPHDLTSAFARYFKSENPRFDESRFVKAATTCPAYRHAA